MLIYACLIKDANLDNPVKTKHFQAKYVHSKLSFIPVSSRYSVHSKSSYHTELMEK